MALHAELCQCPTQICPWVYEHWWYNTNSNLLQIMFVCINMSWSSMLADLKLRLLESIYTSHSVLLCCLCVAVKLAIWESLLDNFVESIQSIPEVRSCLYLSPLYLLCFVKDQARYSWGYGKSNWMLNTFDGKAINVEKLRTPAKQWDKKLSVFRGLGVGFCLGMFLMLCHCHLPLLNVYT